MNTRKKGNRVENKAVKELEAEGWLVYRVKGSTKFNKNMDIFGLFDIIARKDLNIKWIQIKTNRPVPMQPFSDFAQKHCTEYESVEQWIWKDRRGWTKKVVLNVSTS